MAVPFEEDTELALSPLTGEFRDRETELRYRADQLPEMVRQAQFLFFATALVSIVLLAFNLLMPARPETALEAIAPRSAAIIASLVSFFLLGQLRQALIRPLIYAWGIVIVLSSVMLVGIQSHLSILPVLLIPALCYLMMPTHFIGTVICGVISTLLMFGAYVASGPPTDFAVRIGVSLLLLNGVLCVVRSSTARRDRLGWARANAHRRALAELSESRHMMERIFKAVPVPLFVTRASDGIVVRANEAAEKFLQAPAGSLVGRSVTEFYNKPEERTRVSSAILQNELVRETPIDLVRADGQVRSILLSASVMEEDSGKDSYIIAGLMDVTDQQEQQRQIRAAEREYRDLFENAVIGIYRSRQDGKMLRANPALVRFNGYETEAELIAAVNDISDEWYVEPGRRKEWLRLMQENGRVTDFVSEVYRHKTRERVWISENSWTEYDTDGTPLYFEGTLVEANDRKRLEEKIEHMAMYDQLTNLGNRRLLTERLDQACSRAQRYGGYFALMCLDLDRFKAVNDAFGHSTGDQLLQNVAERLKASCRAEDTIARIGGDEFAILSVGIGYPARLALVAERIIAAFAEPFDLNQPPVAIGISIGIAVAPIDGLDPKELMAKADQALYRAKDAGRNQYRFFNESIVERGKNAPLLLEGRLA